MEEKAFIPAQVTGGESIWVSASNTAQSSSDITFTSYTPAGGYTLAYQFAAPTPLTVDAVANGDDTGWTLDITGAQTLVWNPGRMPFAGIVTHTATGRTFVVDDGGVYVWASPLRVSSWAAVLTQIDAAMLTVASNPTGSISLDGQSTTYRGADDLVKLRDYAEMQLRKDSGRRMPRRILTRFV